MHRTLTQLTRKLAIPATVLALAAHAGSLQAGSFRTSWDPLFSDAFSVAVGVPVGWRGTALISVDDACIDASVVVNFPADPCGGATLESYILEFYDVGNDNPLGGGSGSQPGLPALAAVSFDAASIADGMDLAGEIDAGIYSFGNNPASFQALLGFQLDGPTLQLVELCDLECPSYENDSDKYPPRVSWEAVSNPVPVPATLPLVAIGLAGLGLLARSRKA